MAIALDSPHTLHPLQAGLSSTPHPPPGAAAIENRCAPSTPAIVDVANKNREHQWSVYSEIRLKSGPEYRLRSTLRTHPRVAPTFQSTKEKLRPDRGRRSKPNAALHPSHTSTPAPVGPELEKKGSGSPGARESAERAARSALSAPAGGALTQTTNQPTRKSPLTPSLTGAPPPPKTNAVPPAYQEGRQNTGTKLTSSANAYRPAAKFNSPPASTVRYSRSVKSLRTFTGARPSTVISIKPPGDNAPMSTVTRLPWLNPS